MLLQILMPFEKESISIKLLLILNPILVFLAPRLGPKILSCSAKFFRSIYLKIHYNEHAKSY